MKTTHKIIFASSKQMNEIKSESVNLIVTSPPYPMIEMWDQIFSDQNQTIKDCLDNEDGNQAFELMNQELDKVWNEAYRILKPGGITCINIGDATRTIGNNFQLYSNHSRFISYFLKVGFQALPEIIWRKQTNAPNKFMGSGMLPPGAYVTLEHEFILIFRKGSKREFQDPSDKMIRHESSYFWEERNMWFSDIWDFKGVDQKLTNEKTRERSAAYPFELAYRLINMFSVKGDIILDPFLGTGTTTLAAMCTGRNSIGYELDPNLLNVISSRIENIVDFSNKFIKNRLNTHLRFINEKQSAGKLFKYVNENYGFPVVTKQEMKLFLPELKEVFPIGDSEYEVIYHEKSHQPHIFDSSDKIQASREKNDVQSKLSRFFEE